MSVDAMLDQSTKALVPNPYAALWASRPLAPVSLQPSEGAKTANTGAADAAGVYVDMTQKLAKATLVALKSSSFLNKTLPSPTPQNMNLPLSQMQTQTHTTAKEASGTYTHLPKPESSVNHSLTVNQINNLPQFHIFMSQMFETLKTINQMPNSSSRIDSLNKSSVTGLSADFGNYYKNGTDQNSYDHLSAQLNYLAKEVANTPSQPPASPPIAPGQNVANYSKDDVNLAPPNKDNQVTNPNIDKLNASFNSLVSSLQGNVGASSLASFMQSLQHQAHGFSAGGNLVNTSA